MSDATRASQPRWRPVLSVRVRILASILLAAGIGLAASGLAAYVVQHERTLSEIDASLTAVVDETRFIATDSGSASLTDALSTVVQRLRPATNETTLAVIDGKAALTPGGQVDFRLEDPAFVQRIVTETDAAGVVLGTAGTSARFVRYIAVPVSLEGDPGRGIFVAAFDLDAELAPLTEAFRTYAIVATGVLIGVGLVGWFVSGRLLRPIRSLRETAARITASDLSERIPVVGSDDVSALTVTVNEMLDRLDGAITSQRQLLDDVGHELKTPITIVRGHLEVMNERDPADVVATRALAVDELDRMNGLVRDISALAELQRPLHVKRSPVDIAALTDRVRLKASALSDHDWVTRESAHVTADVDADRLTQALLQLAANAATHGAPRGTVEIGSATEVDAAGQARLRLWVTDDGPGISAASQQHIFERFRRGAGGRGSTGSGLGLAIVSTIAAAHGGSVTVRSEAGHGSTFTIDIPLISGQETTL